jgi:MoxR-like ATPase
VQFTSDLLPADVAGISVYEREKNGFVFHPGPIFTQVLLADEINRATPKTQSGLLEAMEERQVTADGVTRALPEPFFVIATQNPAHQVGTFPLPESQLDRFLMCLSLGYPDPAAERALLLGEDRRSMLKNMPAAMTPAELAAAQAALRTIHTSPALIDYVHALVLASRRDGAFAEGLSPRAALALVQASRAWAALEGRDHVIPEDVQAVLVPVCAHRLRPVKSSHGVALASRDLVLQLQKAVPVPQ